MTSKCKVFALLIALVAFIWLHQVNSASDRRYKVTLVVINSGGKMPLNPSKDDSIWVNGDRVLGNCNKPMPKQVKIAFSDLCMAMDASKAARQANPNIGNSKSRSKTKSRTKSAEKEARTKFISRIQEKIVPGLVIHAITVVDDCIWINGSPLDKLATAPLPPTASG